MRSSPKVVFESKKSQRIFQTTHVQFTRRREIAKRIAYADDSVEFAIGKRQCTRVALLKDDVGERLVGGAQLGESRLGGRQQERRVVEARYGVEALLGQLETVSALAAAQIEHLPRLAQAAESHEQLDLGGRHCGVLDHVAVSLQIPLVKQRFPPV